MIQYATNRAADLVQATTIITVTNYVMGIMPAHFASMYISKLEEPLCRLTELGTDTFNALDSVQNKLRNPETSKKLTKKVQQYYDQTIGKHISRELEMYDAALSMIFFP